MPKRSIDSCIDVMNHLKMEGLEEQTDTKTLIKVINLRVTMNPKLQHQYVQHLWKVGFITKSGAGIWDLHHDEVEKLML